MSKLNNILKFKKSDLRFKITLADPKSSSNWVFSKVFFLILGKNSEQKLFINTKKPSHYHKISLGKAEFRDNANDATLESN